VLEMKKKVVLIVTLSVVILGIVFAAFGLNNMRIDTKNAEQNSSVDVTVQEESDLIGTLYIPSIDLPPTPLYRCKSAEEAQLISDNANEAVAMALYSWRNKDVYRVEFGDHNYQNFGSLKWVKEGSVAFVDMGDKIVRMTCISTTLSETLDEYNESIIRDHETVTTVTCYGEDTRTVVRWKITEDSDVSFDELFWIVGKYRVAQRDSSFE
jgi:hypothetical protein